MSKLQLDRLKRFKDRYSSAFKQVSQPYMSCNTSMVSGKHSRQVKGNQVLAQQQINNFMMDESARGTRGNPYFQKQDMEIESGYPSESEARVAKEKNMIETNTMQLDVLNESKISYAPMIKARVPQDLRFRIFQSLAFQGSPHDALDLICLTLRSLEYVSTILFEFPNS